MLVGGVSYAAVKLPKNSVGTSQIKKNAVTGSRVKNSSLTGSDVKDSSLTGSDLKNSSVTGSDVKDGSLSASDFGGSLPAGAAGPPGPTGNAGPPGPTGDAGPSGTISGASAGGALTGSYPNPQIAFDAVTSGGIANGEVRGPDLGTTTQTVGSNVAIGAKVLSGGGGASNSLVFMVESFQSGNGWLVFSRNTDSAAHTIFAIALCLGA